MQVLILVDIPDDTEEAKVVIKRDGKKIELEGKICEIPNERHTSQITGDELEASYEDGFNDCLDEILN